MQVCHNAALLSVRAKMDYEKHNMIQSENLHQQYSNCTRCKFIMSQWVVGKAENEIVESIGNTKTICVEIERYIFRLHHCV